MQVSPEQKIFKRSTLVECHSVLGQIAARRGKDEEARAHFEKGLTEAQRSNLPMLELLAARDWKRHAGASAGVGASIDEAIEAACKKMGKSVGRMAAIL